MFFPFCAQLINRRISLAHWPSAQAGRCSTNQPSSPQYRRCFDKPRKPSLSNKGLSGNPVLAAFGNSRRTGISSHGALPASSLELELLGVQLLAGAVPCACWVPAQADSAAVPARAVRAAPPKSHRDLGEREQLLPGSRLHPFREETCTTPRLSPAGCSSKGGFLDEQLCKKKYNPFL